MSMSDEQFAERRNQLVQELYQPQNPVTESKKKTKRVGEAKAGNKGNTAKPIDSPDGALPVPEGDETPLWELSPEELKARVAAQLWPGENTADNSAHVWTPRPAMTLDQYLKDGI